MAKKASNGDKRILLVDDDAEIIESLRLALEAQDYQVLIARDGNQGLALIERESPDLIILDMMMPKRSGFLVLERLKRLGEKKHRIIMITANEGNRHKAYADYKAVLHGCDIALLPLADTAFNRLKSDIKLIECCAAGVVPICSSTVYGDDPRNAAVSVMVDRPQAFADALAALIADLPRLAQLRAAGRAYVAAERMHAYQVQAREAFYRQVVQDRAALELQRRERMARHGI